jgi:hypothetical protein
MIGMSMPEEVKTGHILQKRSPKLTTIETSGTELNTCPSKNLFNSLPVVSNRHSATVP